MTSDTKEKSIEILIEQTLTGTSREQLGNANALPLVENHGFVLGSPNHFDKTFALDTHLFWQFLENTQVDTLNSFRQFNPSDWQRKIIERFDRMIKKHGVLYLLKKGLKINNAHFNLFYPIPLAI